MRRQVRAEQNVERLIATFDACVRHFEGTQAFERNVAPDHRVDEALSADGWRVVRIWEHEDVAGAVATDVGAPS